MDGDDGTQTAIAVVKEDHLLVVGKVAIAHDGHGPALSFRLRPGRCHRPAYIFI
jgi:hypothetical protein